MTAPLKPTITPDQFSRRQLLDLRQSMAKALADFLRGRRFPDDFGGTLLAEAYEQWPDYLDRFVSPAACVLPSGPMRYAEARLTPTLLEDTWEPRGRAGFGLYALADSECDLDVTVRAPTPRERSEIVAGFEKLFTADGILMDQAQGARYGRLITMDAYWGMPARYSLQEVRIDDSEDSAMKAQRTATFVVRAQAKQVVLRPVFPFQLTVREVDGNGEDLA